MDIFTSESNIERKKSSVPFILTCLTGGAAVAITAICIPFVSPALRRICLPYVPATTKQVENVIAALSHRSRTGCLVDIGSGDGRIVIAAAQAGFTSHGVEINPWLVLYSRIVALKSGVSQATAFHRCDLWKFSLVPYSNVVIFGVEEMMGELESKMAKELTTGTQVVACRFPLPNQTCSKTIGCGIDQVWVYKY